MRTIKEWILRKTDKKWFTDFFNFLKENNKIIMLNYKSDTLKEVIRLIISLLSYNNNRENLSLEVINYYITNYWKIVIIEKYMAIHFFLNYNTNSTIKIWFNHYLINIFVQHINSDFYKKNKNILHNYDITIYGINFNVNVYFFDCHCEENQALRINFIYKNKNVFVTDFFIWKEDILLLNIKYSPAFFKLINNQRIVNFHFFSILLWILLWEKLWLKNLIWFSNEYHVSNDENTKFKWNYNNIFKKYWFNNYNNLVYIKEIVSNSEEYIKKKNI